MGNSEVHVHVSCRHVCLEGNSSDLQAKKVSATFFFVWNFGRYDDLRRGSDVRKTVKKSCLEGDNVSMFVRGNLIQFISFSTETFSRHFGCFFETFENKGVIA